MMSGCILDPVGGTEYTPTPDQWEIFLRNLVQHLNDENVSFRDEWDVNVIIPDSMGVREVTRLTLHQTDFLSWFINLLL